MLSIDSCCLILHVFFTDTATPEIYTLSLHERSSDLKDWFRYESHFVHGRDSLVDILKERGLLSESDAVLKCQQENLYQIGRAVQQECRDRSRMPSSA